MDHSSLGSLLIELTDRTGDNLIIAGQINDILLTLYCRVNQHKTKQNKHQPLVASKTKSVKNKQFLLNKIKDTNKSEMQNDENETEIEKKNSSSVGNKPSKLKFYQSDVKRLKRTQRKRQDRQLKDFASNNVERSIRSIDLLFT